MEPAEGCLLWSFIDKRVSNSKRKPKNSLNVHQFGVVKKIILHHTTEYYIRPIKILRWTCMCQTGKVVSDICASEKKAGCRAYEEHA